VVFLSDNGASREGEASGTTSYLRTLVSTNATDIEDQPFDRDRIDLVGGPRTLVHYPRGWAMASNTPFRLYKINTHAGGHSVPLLLHWPLGRGGWGRGKAMHPGRRDQWAHVTDLLPTLCELAGVDRPAERADIILQPLNGTSLVPVLAEPRRRHERGPQYLEMAGHRGYYDDGWEVVTRHVPLTEFGDHEWELYDLATDRTETQDLAARHPERVAEMAAAWERAARENQVYPLDEGSRLRYVIRPPHEEPLGQPVRIVAGTHTLERYRSQLLIQWRSFDVDVDLRFTAGDRGVLFAHGGQGGGYALYVDAGDDLIFVHNGYGVMTELRCGAVPPATDDIRVSVTAPGNWRWNVEVLVGGERRGSVEELLMLGAMAPFEGIDVGIDRRSPVSWDLHLRHGSFAYTGDLRAVGYTPGEPAPDAGSRFVDLLREVGLRYE
jgi:arylsulfatase